MIRRSLTGGAGNSMLQERTNVDGGNDMYDEMIEKWESAEVVDVIRKGDEYILWDKTAISVGIARNDFLSDRSNARLVKRREPKVPDDVLAIKAVVFDEKALGRQVLIRVNDGDEIWYTAEEDGYRLDELEDIRAMAEVGDFL